MRTVQLLDGSELPVLGLGTWTFGGGMESDYSRDAESVATLRRLIEMGYTHIDTAETYGRNHCEDLVGEAIKAFHRSSVFITTKVAPEHLRYADVHTALEGSLRRLGADYVDLYLIHWPSRTIPLEDSFRAFNELLADGRVRRIGVSNFDLPLLERSIELCDAPIFTNQVRYNLLHREPERNGMLEFCQAQGIVLTAYSPLKDDVLAHPTVVEIARSHGATPAQVAINWLVRQPLVITIPKSSNLQHAQDNLTAVDLALSAGDVARLDQIAR
jgi:diketogulonate reductase-like aldo/keto reductase